MRSLFGSIHASLQPIGPRAGADSGDPQVSLVEFTPQGAHLQVGLWECTPGGWSISERPDTEVVHILSGRVRMTDLDGAVTEIGAGDVMVLPKGWSGRWDILETTRKLYVIAD